MNCLWNGARFGVVVVVVVVVELVVSFTSTVQPGGGSTGIPATLKANNASVTE